MTENNTGTTGIQPAYQPQVAPGNVGPSQDTSGAVAYHEPKPQETKQEEPTNPLENETMVRELMGKIADYVVNASKLAGRVKELVETVESLRTDIDRLRQDLHAERDAHEQTKRSLSDVEKKLAEEKSFVQQCFEENDKVKGERDQAIAERNQARDEAHSWQNQYNDAARQRDNANHECDVLRERNTALAARIEALKNALSGLNSL